MGPGSTKHRIPPLSEPNNSGEARWVSINPDTPDSGPAETKLSNPKPLMHPQTAPLTPDRAAKYVSLNTLAPKRIRGLIISAHMCQYTYGIAVGEATSHGRFR